MSKKKELQIEIPRYEEGQLEVVLIGKTPLITNPFSLKAKRELALPRKKTAADRATPKHDFIQEFRESLYFLDGAIADSAPTLFGFPASGFKTALVEAALSVPGATKKEISGRVWVQGERVPIWGVPRVFIRMVRNSGIDRKPDVRVRAIFPRWATVVRVSYIAPLVNEQQIMNLFAVAGFVVGIGDWRPQQRGSYGQFEPTNPDDPDFLAIVQEGGAVAQKLAYDDPQPYDRESEELWEWYLGEVKRRGIVVEEVTA